MFIPRQTRDARSGIRPASPGAISWPIAPNGSAGPSTYHQPASCCAGRRGPPGQIVVVYLSAFGRIEGSVVRLTPHGFVLNIQATDRKREELAMWLEKLANGESAPRRIDPVVLGKVIEQAALRAHAPPQALIAASAPMLPVVHPAAGYRIYLDAILG